jgi:multidrug efflux system membrane fusion protein
LTSAGSERVGSRRRTAVLVIAAVLAGGGALYYWYAQSGGAPPRVAARAPVPVSVATVARRDLPVYLTGLGTVQASFTVAIRSQVDGKLQDVLFAEGQQVRKGDVLARIDPRMFQAALDQARARRAQDAALLIAAEKDLARSQALAQKDYGSQQSVDQQLAKVDQLKASIAADEAAIETAQTQFDYTSITAPSDGRVGVRLIDPGNLVRANDTAAIATLMLTRPAAVMFTLPARSLSDVRDAMGRGAVEVTAYDQDDRRALGVGTVMLIDNAIDQATATMRLKAVFPNDDNRLWPGDFVNVRLLLETRRDALAIPTAAVQRGPQGLFAWIVTAGNTVEPRPIQVGPTSGDLTIVVAGLSDTERVVTEGHYKLQRNAAVSFQAQQAADTAKAGAVR